MRAYNIIRDEHQCIHMFGQVNTWLPYGIFAGGTAVMCSIYGIKLNTFWYIDHQVREIFHFSQI